MMVAPVEGMEIPKAFKLEPFDVGFVTDFSERSFYPRDGEPGDQGAGFALDEIWIAIHFSVRVEMWDEKTKKCEGFRS